MSGSNHPKAWTVEQKRLLGELAREGKRPMEIGEAIGKPSSSVTAMAALMRNAGADIPYWRPTGAVKRRRMGRSA